MRIPNRSWAWSLLFMASLLGSAQAGTFPALRLTEAFPQLKFKMPVWFSPAPGNDRRFFVVEQKGKVLVFQNRSQVRTASLFLDLSRKVRVKHPEEGLLALAFHPSFARNGFFYVYYIADHPHREVLSRFQVSKKDPNRADPASEKVLLEVPKQFGNHNGSTLLFGPDGYLYFGLGDGGGAGDPNDNAQNLESLWGKILRIDVDHQDPGLAYAIPKDNPFAGKAGARGEIWTYGMRNPWRMSFDRKTGRLWVGDVGQDKWEEIDILQKSGDYGWPILEGTHPYKSATTALGALINPILDYPHKPSDSDKPAAFTGVCVTGGYVYRGSRCKGLEGAYLYADYVLGWVRALRQENGRVVTDEKVIDQPENISSFGEDNAGELYLLGYSNGKVYRLEE